jgi:UDP-N-acetylmuramoyl-L-alanyl-D-glutamate--2,6-diaminopimelate ligase
MGVPTQTIIRAIAKCGDIKGRVERIDVGQPFDVIVDYAHTADSLEALYKAFEGKFIVGVLGNAGGGRDAWKRPLMAQVAERACDHIIFTDEDSYDEDPMQIIDAMRAGIANTKKPVDVIMDRRKAIATALKVAYQHFMKEGTPAAVLITGKGTDPYMMGPNNSKIEWSDAKVAREELLQLYQPTA